MVERNVYEEAHEEKNDWNKELHSRIVNDRD